MKLKKIFKSPYLWAFLVGIFSLHLMKEIALKRRSVPAPMIFVPQWSLINQEEKPFGQKDLAGKPVIMNYFFTSCPTVCPKLTQSMKEVYKRFKDKSEKINFAGITVDPDRDTPKVLHDYMKKYEIDFPNWFLLTGTPKDVYDVVVNKMKVHVGEKEIIEEIEGVYDIPHLAHLALFDKDGNLRGLFKTDAVELSALVRAANYLIDYPEE